MAGSEIQPNFLFRLWDDSELEAYIPLAVSILDAGLTCSASLPCPAEMGASIHINGTVSSVIDTVFVSRQTGRVPRRWIVGTPTDLAAVVQGDVTALAQGGLNATQGDIRCIAHGHLTRLAIWYLRATWNRQASTHERMEAVRIWFREFGGLEAVLESLRTSYSSAQPRQDWLLDGMVRETLETYDEIPF